MLFICISSSSVLAAELNDPTRPPGHKTFYPESKKPVTQRWILSSTLIANGRRNAVINGQLVGLGKVINQAKVASIHPNHVWLIYKQKRIRIKMLANQIKDYSNLADK